MYTLTKIKTFVGRDGHGLNAVICCNEKPIAFVRDEGSGGQMEIDFTNPLQTPASWKASQATFKASQEACLAWAVSWYRNDPGAESARKEKAELEAAYPNARPQRTELQLSWSALEAWVNTAAEQAINEKSQAAQLKRWSKTKTVFRLHGDKPGEYRTLTKPVTHPGVLDFMAKKYGDTLEMIHGAELPAHSAPKKLAP